MMEMVDLLKVYAKLGIEVEDAVTEVEGWPVDQVTVRLPIRPVEKSRSSLN